MQSWDSNQDRNHCGDKQWKLKEPNFTTGEYKTGKKTVQLPNITSVITMRATKICSIQYLCTFKINILWQNSSETVTEKTPLILYTQDLDTDIKVADLWA